jgi:hypothetical protein
MRLAASYDSAGQQKNESISRLSRRSLAKTVALAKADRCDRTMRLAASYDSAGQKETNRFAFARCAAQNEDNTPEQ